MDYKKIGLVMGALDSDAITQIYNGIVEASNKANMSTLGFMICPSAGASVVYNKGEFGIFDVADFSEFDGLIIALNTINSNETKRNIIKNLAKLDIPMVSVDCDVDNTYKIFTSNYSPVKEVVKHLIDVHGKKNINFVGGPTINDESNERLRAYKDALNDYGMPIEKDRIFNGNFYVQDGKDSIEYFMESKTAKVFDAIVCANDIVAISVYSELIKRGYKIPEDVAITGFDYIREGTYMNPCLTTIAKPGYEVGEQAVSILRKLFMNNVTDKVTHIESKVIYRESCGCKPNESSRTDYFRDKYFRTFASRKMDKILNMAMVEDMTDCDNFTEYISVLKKNVQRINPYGFYLCIYNNFYNDLCGFDVIENTKIRRGKRIVNVPICYIDGEFKNYPPFKNDTVLPALADKEGHNYLCVPVHFRNIDYGYIVFVDTDYPITDESYRNWISGINNTINSMHDRVLLNKAISKLDSMYVLDSLTGLYNRFGLERYYNEFKYVCDLNSMPLMFLFVDVNGLKNINDKYGHEQGDHAIYLIARAIEKLFDDRLVATRYGGDEFILLGKGVSESEADTIVNRLRRNIEEEDSKETKQYKISASIGIYIKEPLTEDNLEQCIKCADAKMYDDKRRFKGEIK